MSDSFGNQTKKWMEGRNCLKKSDPYFLNLLIDDLDLVSCLDTSRTKYDDHDTTMEGIVNKAERIVLISFEEERTRTILVLMVTKSRPNF